MSTKFHIDNGCIDIYPPTKLEEGLRFAKLGKRAE